MYLLNDYTLFIETAVFLLSRKFSVFFYSYENAYGHSLLQGTLFSSILKL
jgi:hypothetical protein